MTGAFGSQADFTAQSLDLPAGGVVYMLCQTIMERYGVPFHEGAEIKPLRESAEIKMPRERNSKPKPSPTSAGEGQGERQEMRLIARAASVLRALANEPRGRTLGELANATGLARSTVQRLVGALEAERLVSTTPGQPGVRLGLEISYLASAVHRDTRDLIRPHMDELHHQVQETTDLSILNGGSAIVIDQLASPHNLQVVSHVGRPLPLHCTASGKAHLSQLSDAKVRNILRPPLHRFTAHTKYSVAEILREVRQGAQASYFVDKEEYAEGVCAIGIAISSLASGNFALAISMPTQRFMDKFASYSAIMGETGRAMAAVIGRYSRLAVFAAAQRQN